VIAGTRPAAAPPAPAPVG